MIVTAVRRPAAHTRRAAFTLMEVLVVVAILVVLASIGGISFFRYLEDARSDTTLMKMQAIERACEGYAVKNGGQFPENLQLLIAPPDGGEPFLKNGLEAITDAWSNQIQYELRTFSTGEYGPFLTTTTPKGQQLFWPKKQ